MTFIRGIMQPFISNIQSFILQKLASKSDFTPEEKLLNLSLVSLLLIGIIINTAAFIVFDNLMIFYKLCFMYLVFLFTYVCLHKRYLSLPTLQIMTILTVCGGLISFWFETKGILGAVSFTYIIVIVLGNTLIPIKLHKILLPLLLIMISIYFSIEWYFPSLVHSPFPTQQIEKKFNFVILVMGVVVCGVVIYFLKDSYNKAYGLLKEQNEKLEKTNKELDSLIYSISHDLRAPIVSVMGLVSLHKKVTTNEEALKYIELEEKSLTNLDKFIQDLLNYSRINRATRVIEQVNLPLILEEIIAQHVQFSDKHIELKVNASLKKDFHSDKTTLQIIFQNLIGNAIHYADISKSQSFCHIEMTQNESNDIQVQIIDNGIGIDAKHGEKVFDMFYRANVKTKGSGLGLYIVKEAVTKINGKITYLSKIKEGTTFTLLLPDLRYTTLPTPTPTV